MADWLASGWAIDLILLLIVLEAIGLGLWHWRTGRGPAPAALLPNLAAGACLFLALRLVLGGASFLWVGLSLLLALVAHLLDLWQRW